MAIKKTDSGNWSVDVRPQGTGGKRVSKSFPTKWKLSALNPRVKDSRRLDDLIAW